MFAMSECKKGDVGRSSLDCVGAVGSHFKADRNEWYLLDFALYSWYGDAAL